MKCLLMGDTHGDINLLDKYVDAARINQGTEIDFIVHVGDFGFYRSLVPWYRMRTGMTRFSLPTFVVHGNHEQESELEHIWHDTPPFPLHNLFLFPRGGGMMDFRGFTMFGCGGAFNAPNSVTRDTINFSDNEAIHATKVWRKKGEPKVKLLVTHEAPNHCGPIGDIQYGNPYNCGSAAIRTLWKTIKPEVYICGHYHKNYLYTEDDLTMHILPLATQSAHVLDTTTMTMIPLFLG